MAVHLKLSALSGSSLHAILYFVLSEKSQNGSKCLLRKVTSNTCFLCLMPLAAQDTCLVGLCHHSCVLWAAAGRDTCPPTWPGHPRMMGGRRRDQRQMVGWRSGPVSPWAFLEGYKTQWQRDGSGVCAHHRDPPGSQGVPSAAQDPKRKMRAGLGPPLSGGRCWNSEWEEGYQSQLVPGGLLFHGSLRQTADRWVIGCTEDYEKENEGGSWEGGESLEKLPVGSGGEVLLVFLFSLAVRQGQALRAAAAVLGELKSHKLSHLSGCKGRKNAAWKVCRCLCLSLNHRGGPLENWGGCGAGSPGAFPNPAHEGQGRQLELHRLGASYRGHTGSSVCVDWLEARTMAVRLGK